MTTNPEQVQAAPLWAKTIREMTAEVRQVNTEKGWRTGGNTLGDYIALVHSELAEALEAYRDHRLADATARPECSRPECPDFGDVDFGEGTCPADHANIPKPEGVGSEFADVLIRLVDMCDIYHVPLFDGDMELRDVTPTDRETVDATGELATFGDHIAWLHRQVDHLWSSEMRTAPAMLRALVAVAETFGIDLTAEYDRKIVYNRTRSFQHGGRTLSEAGRSGTPGVVAGRRNFGGLHDPAPR